MIALLLLLAASILTAWVSARWAVSMLECGSFVIALVYLWKRPRLHPILLPFAIVVLWAVLQLAFHWTIAVSETQQSLLHWAAYLCLAFAALQAVPDTQILERFVQVFLIAGFVLCTLSTLQTFTSPTRIFWLFPAPPGDVFVMGPFLNHGQYAAFVELLLPLALVRALDRRGWRYSLMAAGLIASVIASASRAGFVLVALETVVVLLAAGRKRAGVLALTVAAAAAAFTFVVGGDTLAGRFFTGDFDPGRRQMLNSSLDMIRDHGLLGVGLGNWPNLYPFYARYDDGLFANQAHNDWAQWTAEGGIPVLAAMLCLFGFAVYKARTNIWCLGPVFVFVHALVDYPFQKPQVAALVFTLLAASALPKQHISATYEVT